MGRRSRWALELDPYDWVIVHKSGSQHTNADTLLRQKFTKALNSTKGVRCCWLLETGG